MLPIIHLWASLNLWVNMFMRKPCPSPVRLTIRVASGSDLALIGFQQVCLLRPPIFHPASMKSLSIPLSSVILLLLVGCTSSPEEKAEAAPIPLPESALAPAPPPATSTTDASGVTTTPSGLRYRVLASGPADGRSPGRLDSVIVHYRGTLTDGSVFDSSYDRGTPATFGVGQVIPGWTEALQLMKPGDKWMVHIPSHLGYGASGAGAKIPPNSDLVFQVELLQVVSGF